MGRVVAKKQEEPKNNCNAPATVVCKKCGVELGKHNTYSINSKLWGRDVPLCKQCIKQYFDNYKEIYKNNGFANPEKKAIKRMCMMLDLYYGEVPYESSEKFVKSHPSYSILSSYIKTVRMAQYSKKTYDDTINEEGEKSFVVDKISDDEQQYIKTIVDNRTIDFFGTGFTEEDYQFLKNQYDDWTARHECNTKAQEEMFKQICFTQLELLKATRSKQDTKDLNATFLKQLEAAKLQPKQNASETISDSQTFGTLIDKWENTKPIPEVEDDLKDVDRIGKYINIFFKGHLAKMVGIKNAYCKAYDDFMSKYSVKKPEYSSDEDSETLFDTIFGGDLDEES